MPSPSDGRIRAWFDRARARWPVITWAFGQFARHTDGLGQPIGPEGEDLYLAAAAGYLDNDAWEVIEREIRPIAVGRLRNLGNAVDVGDESWSDVTRKMLLFGCPKLVDGILHPVPNMLLRFRGQSALSTLFVTSVVNRAITLTQRERRARDRAVKHASDAPRAAPDPTREDLDAVRSAFGRLPLEDQLVLRLHLEGGTLKELIDIVDLKCSQSALSRRLSGLREHLSGLNMATGER